MIHQHTLSWPLIILLIMVKFINHGGHYAYRKISHITNCIILTIYSHYTYYIDRAFVILYPVVSWTNQNHKIIQIDWILTSIIPMEYYAELEFEFVNLKLAKAIIIIIIHFYFYPHYRLCGEQAFIIIIPPFLWIK